MFTKKALLGLFSFSMFFAIGNLSEAIAQNAPKSTRYVSDQEIKVLIMDSLTRVAGGNRFFQERRSPSEISEINDFVNAWQKVDPSIAPFLGDWGGWEESLAIYPSQTKGQMCLVLSYYTSYGGTPRTINEFSLGKVSGNKLLVVGERGKQVILRERGTIKSGKSIDFLAIFGVYDRRTESGEFVNRKLLQEVKSSRLAKFGCTASLPSNNQTQASIAKHPAELVATDFYDWYLNNENSYRNLIYQKRNSFTPNLYRYLERAIRIAKLPKQYLDYALFSFVQVKTYSFTVDTVNVNNDVAEVYINLEVGLRKSRSLQPIKVVVIRNGGKWQIANIFFDLKNRLKYGSLLSVLVEFNERQEFRNIPWEDNDASRLSDPPSSIPIKQTDMIAKYPTNNDFNAFEDKLQGNPESLVKLRGNQAEQRRKFQNDWKDRNPNAAKFLGAWYTGDRYFYVFPATVKGGTCVVTQDANGKLNMQVGTVLNKELRYGGGKGFFWRDRPNIIASRDSGLGSLYPIYATSRMPELSESIIGDMERQKCITRLPF